MFNDSSSSSPARYLLVGWCRLTNASHVHKLITWELIRPRQGYTCVFKSSILGGVKYNSFEALFYLRETSVWYVAYVALGFWYRLVAVRGVSVLHIFIPSFFRFPSRHTCSNFLHHWAKTIVCIKLLPEPAINAGLAWKYVEHYIFRRKIV